MPICCEPGERFPIVLDGDKGKSPEPTFWCRHLSAREFQAMFNMAGRISSENDADKRLAMLSDSLAESLVDWTDIPDRQGKPLFYAPAAIMDVLTIREAWELWDKIVKANRLSGADAKKSDSPSHSDSDSTAAVEDQGLVEIAPTRPAP